jgi:Protein of unknown function (DUF2933)
MTIHIGSKTLLAVGALLLVAAASVAAGLIALSQVVWLGLLVICPLAMFFMMQGIHGGHGDQEHRPVPLAIPISDSREDE